MADEKKKKKKKKEDEGGNEPPAPPPSKAASRKSAGSSARKAKKGGPGSSVFEMFSQRQVAEFKEGFQMMDKDKDGVIGTKDLMETFDELGKVVTEKEVEDMLADAPAPINFTMLLTMFAERQSGGSDDDDVVVAALRAFEGEGGFIDGKNLRMALMTWGDKFTENEVDAAFEQMEADEDEMISCSFVCEMLTGKVKDDDAPAAALEAAA